MAKRKKVAEEAKAGGIRSRIRELRHVPGRELVANAKNYRQHGERQTLAMQQLLATIGFAGAVLVREDADGRLHLIDGHLRQALAGDELVPVLVTDLTAAESDAVLATFDRVTGLADTDAELLDKLVADVLDGTPEVADVLKLLDPEPEIKEERVKLPGESYSVLVECADEREQLGVIEELDRNGFAVRALTVGLASAADEEDAKPQAEPPAVAGEIVVNRKVAVKRSPRVIQLEGMFDVPPAKKLEKTWRVQMDLSGQDWRIGLITGPSGAGKSTIARELFGSAVVESWDWPQDAAIVDGFPQELGIAEITGLLSSVGFSSPPNWMKPFHVLSNGEQFRVNLARTLAELPELAVVDEFTSVVDRQVAQIGSAAVAKAVRASGRRFVAVTCHYDVEDWLDPDWVYDVHAAELRWRSLRRRPPIELRIRRATAREWSLFSDHHYLSGNLHKAAGCFVGMVGKKPAAFAAVLSNPGKDNGWWREHRVVCLPDFQGVGIGNRISEFVASLYRATGKPYRSTTSHPSMIRHRCRSALWRLNRAPALCGSASESKDFVQYQKTRAKARMTAGFEYVGPVASAELARQLGVLKA